MVVVPEAEMMNTQSEGELESPLIQSESLQPCYKNQPILSSSLGRQSSIYSLTLDEFQHTLCESGKNFGSMNMDEFLSSIWNAEENHQAYHHNNNNNNNNSDNLSLISEEAASTEKGIIIRKQPSLPRQGSLTIPAPLCGKTVDDVWSEIHNGHQRQQQHQNQSSNKDSVQNTDPVPRQPTFGEMTLEDFLIKAGVVRERCPMPAPSSQLQQQQQHGMYPNNYSTMVPPFVGRPVIGIGGAAGNVVAPPYRAVAQGGGGAIGEPSGYAGNGKRDTGYPPPPPTGVCFGGGVVNGGGGYGAAPPSIGMAAPLSPVSSEGNGIGAGENSGRHHQFGVDMGLLRGRKRIIDGPVEKVVERRQRRMIKNRESAARSRARKQAYTVELEAELNQLREENAQLKQALAELERRRKQQCFEEVNVSLQTKAQKATEILRALRRNLSCSL